MNGKFFGRQQKISLVFILFTFFVSIVFCQENQINDNKKLKEEILAVFKTGSEEGLRDFVKSNKDSIENKFIVNFAESGVKERNQEWLKISEIIAEEKRDEKALAGVYYNMGEYYRATDGERAIGYFDKALLIYVKLDDLIGQGNVYIKRGWIFFAGGENARAFEMYDYALGLFEKVDDSKGMGNVYLGKGVVYTCMGNNAKGLEMYDKALPFFEKIGDSTGQGNVYLSKGDVYLYTGKHSNALEMYDKVLPFIEKNVNPILMGHVCFKKGRVYFNIGQNEKSLELYNKAFLIFQKEGDILDQGNVLWTKGEVYLYSGDNSKAIELYDKALIFFKKIGEPRGQGSVYNSKGEIYYRIGHYFKALEMYDRALTFFEKSENSLGLGNVYSNKGNVYFRTGNNSKSLENYNKALTFLEKAGDPMGQGDAYWRKGVIYFVMGNNSNALEMYGQALHFFEKSKNLWGQGNVCHSQGEIYFRTGDNSKALCSYDKAQTFFLKAEDPLGQGEVYLSIGEIYFKNGEFFKSLEMYDKAFVLCKKGGDVESESYALLAKARVLAKQGKNDDSRVLFEKSISNLEKIRGQTIFSAMQMTFMGKVYDKYEEIALFMLNNKYYERGFKYTESMKSRVFLDLLAEGLVKLDKGITPNLKQKKDNFVSKLSILSKEINTTAGKQDEKKLKELKDQYSKVESEFEELLIKIRLKNPLYASVRYPEPVSVQDLQDTVLEEGELLLRYFIAKDKIYVFLISKEDFKVVTLKDTAKDINEIVEQYLIAVEENNPRRMKEYGKALYQKLVKPLETWIKNREEIIIIPDRELATVPFESLVMDDTQSRKPVYLLEKYRIKYIQSASALAILRKHYQRQGAGKHFIGFGDPVYDYENFKQDKPEKGSFARSREKSDEISQIHRGRYQREGGVLNRLKGSGEEVNAIAELFKKQEHQAVVYEREKATEEKAKSPDIREFDYIHLSCHGVLGDGFQGLVLSQIPGSSEDGYLTLNEIMNSDYNAKLVVLSACRTGKGKMERAEGVTGLTRAVMYAGTPAVIASLWDVDDKATKELMIRFYRYMLGENSSKEEALRQAKLDLIKGKKYASPVHWSAFVMYGE
jgi:CHAT domain-containing protein/Tfp pilus assembly protein PilF